MWWRVSFCSAAILLYVSALRPTEEEKFILCLPDHGAMKFNIKINDLEDFPSPEGSDCSREGLSKLCRQAYSNVLEAVNYTFIEDYAIRRSLRAPSHKGTCQEYTPAKELKVPTGSWSDRLVAAPNSDCIHESHWFDYASAECGKVPTQQSFGDRCDETSARHRDMVFVCDQPRLNDTLIDPPIEKQLVDLEHYVKLAQKLKTALADKEEVEIIQNIRDQLVNLSKTVREEGFDSDLTRNIQLEFSRSEIQVVFDTFVSRSAVFTLWKQCAIHAGLQRSYRLINYAFALLSNDSTAIDLKANLTDFGVDTVACHAQTYLFPELQPKMEKFYLFHIQQETPGFSRKQLAFLGQPNGHEKLISMYEKVFDPELLDQRNIPKRSFFISLSSAVVTLGLVSVCATVVLYGCSRRIKQYHIGDHSVIYNRFNNCPIDDKDTIVDMEDVPDNTATA